MVLMAPFRHPTSLLVGRKQGSHHGSVVKKLAGHTYRIVYTKSLYYRSDSRMRHSHTFSCYVSSNHLLEGTCFNTKSWYVPRTADVHQSGQISKKATAMMAGPAIFYGEMALQSRLVIGDMNHFEIPSAKSTIIHGNVSSSIW